MKSWLRVSSPLRSLIKSRRYTTTSSAQHSIYISNSPNPYFNLTFEDWLFKHKAHDEPLLLIYRNEPCVIVGRNQNPWKEVNFKALQQRPGLPFIRRRSGGGTVYHDLGNTNYSIHLSRAEFNRNTTAQIVLRAVRSLGINARVNDRNDICVGDDKMSVCCIIFLDMLLISCPHVSGSAYKIVNKRAYHHGTMLISTQLDTLGDLLRTNKGTMITKGVASVRSPVCNLRQHSSTITHDTFANAVVEEFRKEYSISAPTQVVEEKDGLEAIEYIERGIEELHTWDWAYGQTPEFTYTVSQTFDWGDVTAEIRSKHGIINQCTFSVGNPKLSDIDAEGVMKLGQSLEGQKYGFLEKVFGDEGGPRKDVWRWLDGLVYA
ncbi:hypothetical protein H0H93_013214 [Arthromyces matolae]|nr:hypothetical protein H0H93_013214 [Arthromyces matolae]